MKSNQIMSIFKKWPSIKWFCVLALSAVLVGCSGSSGKAPVYDRAHAARTPVTSGHYVVKRGDTLYSIAFRFGWDWRRLAAHNGIRAPYVIVPGQVIRFSGAARAPWWLKQQQKVRRVSRQLRKVKQNQQQTCELSHKPN